jgi:hypothetical protein
MCFTFGHFFAQHSIARRKFQKKAQENFALGHCVQGKEKGPGRRPIVGQGDDLRP